MNQKLSLSNREAVAEARPLLGLAEPITPITVESFAPDYFRGVLTLDDIDGIIANSSLCDGDLRLVTDGTWTAIAVRTRILPTPHRPKTMSPASRYRRSRRTLVHRPH